MSFAIDISVESEGWARIPGVEALVKRRLDRGSVALNVQFAEGARVAGPSVQPEVAARLTAPNISRVACPSSAVPLDAADSLAYEFAVESRSRPSWRAVARTNSISRPTDSAPPMLVNVALNLAAVASAPMIASAICLVAAIAPATLNDTPIAPNAVPAPRDRPLS